MKRNTSHDKSIRLESPFHANVIKENYTELCDEDLRSLIASAKARLYMRIVCKTSPALALRVKARNITDDKLPALLTLQCGPRTIALLEEVLQLREILRESKKSTEHEMAPPSIGSEEGVQQAYAELQKQMNAFLLDKSELRKTAGGNPKKIKSNENVPSHFDNGADDYY